MEENNYVKFKNKERKNIMGTLVNGIKEIFAKSQTTATHLPVCASDGTPQGRISVGDLASVLGVQYTTLDENNDLNNVLSVGRYAVLNGHNPSHGYSGMANATILVIPQQSGDSQRFLQLAYEHNFQKFYYRNYNSSSQVWSDWHLVDYDIPSFYKNYNTLDALANGLGINKSSNITLPAGIGSTATFGGGGANSKAAGLWGIYEISATGSLTVVNIGFYSSDSTTRPGVSIVSDPCNNLTNMFSITKAEGWVACTITNKTNTPIALKVVKLMYDL